MLSSDPDSAEDAPASGPDDAEGEEVEEEEEEDPPSESEVPQEVGVVIVCRQKPLETTDQLAPRKV